MFTKLRKFENMHIALWLLKDTCWVMDFKPGGLFMIVPTLSVAFYLTWQLRKEKAELFHNLAVCFWIMANSVWMIGEFYFNDSTRPLAAVFFAVGLLSIAYFYLGTLPKIKRAS